MNQKERDGEDGFIETPRCLANICLAQSWILMVCFLKSSLACMTAAWKKFIFMKAAWKIICISLFWSISYFSERHLHFFLVSRNRNSLKGPVLTTQGNPSVAIGGPPLAIGGGKLAKVEAFPPVVHR